MHRSAARLIALHVALAGALLGAGGCQGPSPDAGSRATGDPLPSWTAGGARQAIIAFVERTGDPESPEFVPAAERIAVFDNDGTLWAEQPLYFQLLFAIDRVTELAGEHPEWRKQQPFRAVLENDRAALAKFGGHEIMAIVQATHAGMTTDEFATTVRDWIGRARHPRFDRPYTECVYQPMLELLDYLRANGWKTFIVSGGGIEFMRVFSEEVYGIPPEQVVGSSIALRFAMRDGEPVLVREPEIFFVDDKAGKPVGIQRHIGRRPVFAAGNSDGDLEMLQFTTVGRDAAFAMIVHHDDADREWTYDRDSSIGRLAVALDEAAARGWTVVSMKEDWRRVFPWE